MKKYKIVILAIFACVSLKGWAQEEGNVVGKVIDKLGNPVEGALILLKTIRLYRLRPIAKVSL